MAQLLGTGRVGLLRSTAWSAVDFWTQQSGALLTFIVVGNLIGPAAVGVLTIGQLAVTVMMSLLLDGFSDALIQRQRLEPAHFSTAFWLLAGCGVATALVLWAAAAPLAMLFAEPELSHVLPLLAIGLPFVGIGAAYQALLQRELRFGILALRSVVSQVAGFCCALALARDGQGVLALVGYFVVARALDAVLLAGLSRHWPGLGVSRAALADIVGFGRHRVGNQLAGIVVMQVDRFTVGYFLGAVSVGLYSVAERITGALVNGLGGVIARVGFPAFSARQDNPPAFRRATGDFLAAVNLVAVPVFVGLAMVSADVVGLLFDARWSAAALPLAVLALAGIPYANNYILTSAINAHGRPDIAAWYSLRIMAARLAVSLAAAMQGVVAVAVANLAVTALSTLLVARSVSAVLPGSGRQVLHSLRVPALAAAAMAGATLAAGAAMQDSPALPVLVAKVTAGAVAYGLALAALAPEAWRRLRLIRASAGRPATSAPAARTPTASPPAPPAA